MKQWKIVFAGALCFVGAAMAGVRAECAETCKIIALGDSGVEYSVSLTKDNASERYEDLSGLFETDFQTNTPVSALISRRFSASDRPGKLRAAIYVNGSLIQHGESTTGYVHLVYYGTGVPITPIPQPWPSWIPQNPNPTTAPTEAPTTAPTGNPTTVPSTTPSTVPSASPTTVVSTAPSGPGGGGGGGGCSTGGMLPAAMLLLAPLAFFLRR